MANKFVHQALVEVGDDGVVVASKVGAYLGGGTKTVAAAAAPEALTATPTPCRMVLIQPIRDTAGNPTNTHNVLIGNSAGQTVVIDPDSPGVYIPASDASSVYAKVVTNGEGVVWSAFGVM